MLDLLFIRHGIFHRVSDVYKRQILARKGECLSKRQKPGKKPVFEDTGKEPTAIEKAKRYIEENYLEKITLHDLAVRFMLSEAHLCREFTKKFHMSPIKYINFLRLERAKELLAATEKMCIRDRFHSG